MTACDTSLRETGAPCCDRCIDEDAHGLLPSYHDEPVRREVGNVRRDLTDLTRHAAETVIARSEHAKAIRELPGRHRRPDRTGRRVTGRTVGVGPQTVGGHPRGASRRAGRGDDRGPSGGAGSAGTGRPSWRKWSSGWSTTSSCVARPVSNANYRPSADVNCSVEGCDQPTIAHGWCSKHYQRWRRTDDPIGGRGHDMTLEERFWSYVDRREPDECWPWTGATARGGYGTFMVPNRRWTAAGRRPTSSPGCWDQARRRPACRSCTPATTRRAATPLTCSSAPTPTTCATSGRRVERTRAEIRRADSASRRGGRRRSRPSPSPNSCTIRTLPPPQVG